MRKVIQLAAIVLVWLVIIPAAAHAQASITGVVRDSSGAVLPGATVEATSPALIEQVRTAVTDETGQYRIVDLRPGTYTVIFSLASFTTVRREGIELTGTFVATVNAELRVGAVAETVTVTGESPIVDIQSSRTQQTINRDILASIPTGRQYYSITVLVPALNVQGHDVGGTNPAAFSVFQVHGGRRNEGQVRIDGLSAGWQGMGVSGYVPEITTADELTFTLMGGLAESNTGGPQMNIVPRQGGNTFSGTFFGTFAGEGWQGTNLTPELQAAGLRVPNQLIKSWDVNGSFGGPIRKDRVWFYWTGRHQGNRSRVANIFYNKNAGDVTKWTYDPDSSRQAQDDGTWKNSSMRVTVQGTPRNKFTFWWDEQSICQHCISGGAASAAALVAGSLTPEAQPPAPTHPMRMAQTTWTSPVSSRLLLEAGFGVGPHAQFGSVQRAGDNRDLIPVTELGGVIPGLTYRGYSWARNWGHLYTGRGSLSYITGAHSLKFGGTYQGLRAEFLNAYNTSRTTYTFNNGAPFSLTQYLDDEAVKWFETGFTSLYAQDQWTTGRLTLQGGVRFERIGSFFPEQQLGPDRFVPTAIAFAAHDYGVSAKDLSPRMGGAYDVFGNGRTALRFSLGRFPTPENSYGIYAWLLHPTNLMGISASRSWNDKFYPVGDSRRGNFAPDCDLFNPNANLECGRLSNINFGKNVTTTTYDPAILNGWNIREYSWDLSLGVQQQLAPRVSAEVTYVRRTWGNQTVTNNRAVEASDFSRFSVAVPVDPRLPTSGVTLASVYDVNPAKFGLVDNLVTFAKNYGDYTENFNGVDLTIIARMRNNVNVQGGFSTGRSALDNCEVAASQPEILTLGPPVFPPGLRQPLEFCDQQTPFLTQVKGLASYTIPRIDVQVAGTFQSRPYVGANFPGVASQSILANWVVPNAAIAPSLLRALAGGAQAATVMIARPGTVYGDRINQIDLRLAKILRYHRTRTNAAVDLFNLFNTNATQAYQQTYTTAGWLTPTLITSARLAKFTVQVDF